MEVDTIEIEADEKEDAEIDTIETKAEEIKLVDGYAKGTEAMAKTKNTKFETEFEEKRHRVAEAVAKAKEIIKEKELEEEKCKKKKDFEEEKRKKKGRVKKEE